MIIGSGMIANALQLIDKDDVLFFCSGVSNSGERNEEAFEKEKQLLLSFAGTDRKLIYFSSYFVNFEKYWDVPYYRHKVHMEETIRQEFRSYTVYRLPQVVGRSGNPNTLTNFIAQKISKGESLSLYAGAVRNLIDIEDVVKVIAYANDFHLFTNRILNLIAPKNYAIEQIVDVFESVMGVKALRKTLPCTETEFDIWLEQDVKTLYQGLEIHFDETYLEKLIFKYYTRS